MLVHGHKPLWRLRQMYPIDLLIWLLAGWLASVSGGTGHQMSSAACKCYIICKTCVLSGNCNSKMIMKLQFVEFHNHSHFHNSLIRQRLWEKHKMMTLISVSFPIHIVFCFVFCIVVGNILLVSFLNNTSVYVDMSLCLTPTVAAVTRRLWVSVWQGRKYYSNITDVLDCI